MTAGAGTAGEARAAGTTGGGVTSCPPDVRVTAHPVTVNRPLQENDAELKCLAHNLFPTAALSPTTNRHARTGESGYTREISRL